MSKGILRIVKFGGKSLSTPALVQKAAALLSEDFKHGNRVVAVVSAQGGSTDSIVSQLSQLGQENAKLPQAWDVALSYGERLSAALLHSALVSADVQSKLYDPTGSEWPIVSDSHYGCAAVDVERTRLLCRSLVEPCLEYMIPVIPGFVARSHDGKITTLGRGGSDVTAFVLGRCLEADEIVTNVDGFYVGGKRVKEAGVDELRSSCHDFSFGVESRCRSLIAPAALEHFVFPTVLRIVSHNSESINSEGSVIYPSKPAFTATALAGTAKI
jgi:aspartate kinase